MLESRDLTVRTAEMVAELGIGLGCPAMFKGSFLKANRTAADAPRGPGRDQGLYFLAEARRATGLALLTDIHEVGDAPVAAAVADMLQIPAFLCRQTPLLEAAGRTGRPVNVKKGQFMAPDAMRGAIDKVRAGGGRDVVLTERGTVFGYGDLVVDMRGIAIMRGMGVPVFYDATHSVQRPAISGTEASGGNRAYVLPLARAAAAAGANGLYMEVHPDPASSPSDRDTILGFAQARAVATAFVRVWEAVRGR